METGVTLFLEEKFQRGGPVGAMYLHARMFCTLSDTILYPLRAPIFTMITEVWPRANRAVVTNNLTVIIEVVLRGPCRQKISFFIIHFYAIMHRTTIVQNKIIIIICSCLFLSG